MPFPKCVLPVISEMCLQFQRYVSNFRDVFDRYVYRFILQMFGISVMYDFRYLV